MASGPGVDQGKGRFIRDYFGSHPEANAEMINDAWSAGGNDGQISVSLISKIKADLGLTRGSKGPAKAVADAPRRGRGRPRKVDQATNNGEHVARATRPRAHHADAPIDEVEDTIGDLIGKLRELGGHQDAIRALRRARRLLDSGSDE